MSAPMEPNKDKRAAVVLRWERGLGLCVRTYLPDGRKTDEPVLWWQAPRIFSRELRRMRRQWR